jgi:zinc transport system ATP-binding protein
VSETIVKVKEMSVYYGGVNALSDINLEVKKGDFLGIIGPNGGGKSTLLKAVLGLVPLNTGEVRIFGEKPEKARNKTGYVPQYIGLDKSFPVTVNEVVLTGRLKPGIKPFFRYSKSDREAVDEILSKVGIHALSKRRISELSGGEFQKMLIARALVSRPELLLLDEPTASVDARSREQIYSLLSELNKDMTIILVTHDLFAVSTQVKSLACLNTNLVYHGKPELNESIVHNLYGCPVDLIAHGVPHRVLGEHEHGDCGGSIC